MQKFLLIFMLFFINFKVGSLDYEPLSNKYFEEIEKKLNGKIGVYAIDTNKNEIIFFRENEKFPVQSTMKMLVVGALLKKSEQNIHLLDQDLVYPKGHYFLVSRN